MTTLKIFSSLLIVVLASTTLNAQKATKESFRVSGECGMCKKKIEKAAKDAGATTASWSTQTKLLTVSYDPGNTNTTQIQQRIAGVGYDTPGFKATDEAYYKLDACCQYSRGQASQKLSACPAGCQMQDGKCKDEAACKAKGCCKDNAACCAGKNGKSAQL